MSQDAGKTWRSVAVSDVEVDGCFLDEEHDRLIRHYLSAQDPHGAFGARQHDVLCQVSSDQGRTWGEPQAIGRGSYFYRPIKLADGRLLWPYTESVDPHRYHARLGVLLGRWMAARCVPKPSARFCASFSALPSSLSTNGSGNDRCPKSR